MFHHDFTYNITIGEDVDTFAIQVPSMLLQPLFKNPIKHGILKLKNYDDAAIDVNVYTVDDFAYCVISNAVKQSKKSTYLKGYIPQGLKITENRLALLRNLLTQSNYPQRFL